ncbi:hypothetical protein [Enterococcus casseliflavus]|nr:hypothetical protein [Enterococcus casseliflavus]
MEKEIQYLKDRITFLEALIDFQNETVKKSIDLNTFLIRLLEK